eukprot:767642-Hanusia_phi.AAC.3
MPTSSSSASSIEDGGICWVPSARVGEGRGEETRAMGSTTKGRGKTTRASTRGGGVHQEEVEEKVEQEQDQDEGEEDKDEDGEDGGRVAARVGTTYLPLLRLLAHHVKVSVRTDELDRLLRLPPSSLRLCVSNFRRPLIYRLLLLLRLLLVVVLK